MIKSNASDGVWKILIKVTSRYIPLNPNNTHKSEIRESYSEGRGFLDAVVHFMQIHAYKSPYAIFIIYSGLFLVNLLMQNELKKSDWTPKNNFQETNTCFSKLK